MLGGAGGGGVAALPAPLPPPPHPCKKATATVKATHRARIHIEKSLSYEACLCRVIMPQRQLGNRRRCPAVREHASPFPRCGDDPLGSFHKARTTTDERARCQEIGGYLNALSELRGCGECVQAAHAPASAGAEALLNRNLSALPKGF